MQYNFIAQNVECVIVCPTKICSVTKQCVLWRKYFECAMIILFIRLIIYIYIHSLTFKIFALILFDLKA